jgi:hypothetical protein
LFLALKALLRTQSVVIIGKIKKGAFLKQKFIGVEKSNFVLLTTTKTTEFITFKTFRRLRFDRK